MQILTGRAVDSMKKSIYLELMHIRHLLRKEPGNTSLAAFSVVGDHVLALLKETHSAVLPISKVSSVPAAEAGIDALRRNLVRSQNDNCC